MFQNNKEKRTIITLSFKNDKKKKQSETDISLDSKEKLVERQKQLKEMQNKRNNEQKEREQERLKQKFLEEKQRSEAEITVIPTETKKEMEQNSKKHFDGQKLDKKKFFDRDKRDRDGEFKKRGNKDGFYREKKNFGGFNRNREDGNGFNRDRNRDGGDKFNGDKNKEDSNGFNRDGNRNRDEGGGFNRDRNRDGNNNFNRDRNKEGNGGFNREKSRDSGGFFNRDRNKNREWGNGFNRDKKSFGDFKDRTNRDNLKKNNDNKKQSEAEKERLNKKIIDEQQKALSENKKMQFKEPKKKYNNQDNDDNKTSRKVNKDKSEKFMQNLRTIVFNNDDSDDGFSSRGNRNNGFRKKNKNNGVSIQSKQKIFQTVNIPDLISVSDLADRMNEKKADVVKKLLTMGMRVNVNQMLDSDTAELIVVEFGHTPNRVSDSDIEKALETKYNGNYINRSPVVTVMGHVDHGKTSLLDALRTTNVAEKESGGITQHIGASSVNLDNGKFITFIDTPGHEAFTEMRMRGANITDIVILVVAADDGIKEQTIEAINHIKAANAPMIVAINKIDKPGANPEKVKQDLLQYGVILEDFGGSAMSIGVSAKEKINLDKLMEIILLQAEILELKAPIDCKASGAVIESKMDARKGAVCSVLVQRGILRVGDIIIAGTGYGKIKTMVDDKNENQKEVGPSRAVEVLGFNSNPSAGDTFNVVASEKEARDVIAYRSKKNLEGKDAKRAGKSIEGLLQEVKDSNKKRLSVIIKADVSGSAEAIANSLTKLNTEEVEINIVHSAIGAINESDINLANTSNAIVIAFNVRASADVKSSAQHKGVEIKYYSIIYNIIDDVTALMSGLLNPTLREEILGQAEIRSVIKVASVGKIAGCYVTSGEILRSSNIRLIRDNIVVFSGKIKTLRRFKDEVKEVKFGFECGISIENYDDIREKDVIECYKIVEEKRSL